MRLNKNELIQLLNQVESVKAGYPDQRWGQLIMVEGWAMFNRVFHPFNFVTSDPKVALKTNCFYDDSKIMRLFSEILDEQAKEWFLNSEFFKRLYK